MFLIGVVQFESKYVKWLLALMNTRVFPICCVGRHFRNFGRSPRACLESRDDVPNRSWMQSLILNAKSHLDLGSKVSSWMQSLMLISGAKSHLECKVSSWSREQSLILNAKSHLDLGFVLGTPPIACCESCGGRIHVDWRICAMQWPIFSAPYRCTCTCIHILLWPLHAQCIV